ncbi:MAG: HEAT repeat domain-containing protein [Chloroflexi bacterium]|nr:HEAT repeat domain-containing protein [Chloroflexota bacterium]
MAAIPHAHIAFPIRRSSLKSRIVWEGVVLISVILVLGVVSLRTDLGTLLAPADTAFADRSTMTHEEIVRGATAELTVPQLIGALKDTDPGVRVSAAQELGWRRADGATSALLEATYDPNVQVQEEAATALGEIGSISALPRLRALQVVQGNSDVQLAAIEGEDQVTERIAAELQVPRSDVQAVAVAPNGAAYAAMSDDLYILDQGTWRRVHRLPALPVGLALGPDGQLIYLSTPASGLYRSKDGGKTWEHAAFGAATATQLTVTAAVVNPSDSHEIYVAIATIGPSGGPADSLGIAASHDGGNTWTAMAESPKGAITKQLVMDPAAPDYLYGQTDGGAYRMTVGGNAPAYDQVASGIDSSVD